jgi:hypothetical protein
MRYNTIILLAVLSQTFIFILGQLHANEQDIAQVSNAELCNKYYGKERFVITGDSVNIRVNPDLKSNAIASLQFGDIVYFLSSYDKTITIDGKEGKWVFVIASFMKRISNTNSEIKHVKGWVFDYYIAYPANFAKLKEWKNKKIITGGVSDYQHIFEIKDNADFILKIPIYHSGQDESIITCNSKYKGNWNKNDFTCIVNGHMYVYKDIYWAKLEKPSSLGYIYIYFDKKNKPSVAVESVASIFGIERFLYNK